MAHSDTNLKIRETYTLDLCLIINEVHPSGHCFSTVVLGTTQMRPVDSPVLCGRSAHHGANPEPIVCPDCEKLYFITFQFDHDRHRFYYSVHCEHNTTIGGNGACGQ